MDAIEIVNTREFAAPRQRVFAAFAVPAALAQWWGPAGFTNRVPEFDFRPGGAWRIIMRAPDGAEFDNHSRFVDIAAPERIAYDHLEPVHQFRMTMLFDEHGAHATRVTWRMQLERRGEHERLREFLHQANEQNFDRLQAFLRIAATGR